MAAYLKSALLLPKDPTIDPSPEELALRLQLRLERLNAMRESGARLMARDRVGRDVFLRGTPEGLRVVKRVHGIAIISNSLPLMARSRRALLPVLHVVKKRAVMTLEEALERVRTMIGQAVSWTDIHILSSRLCRSAIAPLRARIQLCRGVGTCAARHAGSATGRKLRAAIFEGEGMSDFVARHCGLDPQSSKSLDARASDAFRVR